MNEKSIAVLPFVNMSADPENEYFSDGITEEIINALTTVKSLNVTARTSSFAFKNKKLDVRTIGSRLGVSTILEGSVRKEKNNVRITAQLIDCGGGFHLWSKTFDRKLNNIFALQDEISLLIADQIRENFGHLELKAHLVDVPKVSFEGYERYLKAKHYLYTYNKINIQKGISILEEIIEQQPDFALAFISIHYGYNILASAGYVPKRIALEKGILYLNRALQLNDRLPECYHSLGWHSLNQNWDFIAARKYLEKALELSPAYADAHQKLFITFALEGKHTAAFQHLNKALELDPLSPLNSYFLGYYYYLQQQYQEADRAFKNCFELGPHFLFGYAMYALSLIGQGKAHLVAEESIHVPEIEGKRFEVLLMNTLANCHYKDLPNAEQGLAELQVALKEEENERFRFFLIHMLNFLGREEQALAQIEEGVARKEPLMSLLREDPLLKPLHRFERFQHLMQKIYALSDSVGCRLSESNSPLLLDDEIEAYRQKLDHLLVGKKVYLNPALSLRTLAEQLQVHPNKLSWLINVQMGKNFNEFINSFRLTAFKEKALDPANRHFSLLGLAFESGFNSKTVFNTFFKKSVGMSPGQWLKGAKSQQPS